MSTVKRSMISIITAVLTFVFIVAPIANADTLEVDQSVVDCTSGMFAIGGYPKPENVPDGYVPIETPGGIFFWQKGGYIKGQTTGAENLVKAVDAYAAVCPEAPIFIRGHSYGAAIVHTALETIDKRPYASRVTVNVTGNPRNPGGIEDTWTGSLGIVFRGAGIIPENVVMVSECNPRDGICDMPEGSAGQSLAILGYFTGAHRYN